MLRNTLFTLRIKTCPHSAPLLGAASMSQYGPHFIQPVFKPIKQKELIENNESEKYAHVPIKAARNNDSSSIFHDDILSQFTNYVMKGGKKQLARDIIEKGFENIKRIQLEKYHSADAKDKESIELNPITIFHRAVENSRPLLQLQPIKRGGSTYQVPIPITDKRSYFEAMRWIVQAAREKEKPVHFPEKLAWELLDASNNTGRVIKKKQDLHRQCEANRAYAHYRWS